MADFDFDGGSGGIGGSGSDATGPYFRFVDLIVTKAQGDFTIEYPKLLFHLGPLMVASATSEYQKHTILTSLIQYYTAALSPIMSKVKTSHNKKISPELKKDLIQQFEELKGHATSCGVVKISAELSRSGDYNKYIYLTDYSNMPKEVKSKGENVIKVAKNSETMLGEIEMTRLQCSVECGEGAMLVGREIARDNGYSRINCQAENTMNKALTLAFDLGIIDLNDNLRFESGNVTPEDNERNINRRERIRDILSEPEDDEDDDIDAEDEEG